MTDTDYDVDPDVEAVVEDTELPRRLKDRVYETILDRDGEVPVEKADEIARAVENRYVETRVDPLDPVGTVSAQSIGEPGTQMSVPADERVIVRRGGRTETVAIGSLVDEILANGDPREAGGHEVALAPGSLEVPSLRSDERVEWKPVEEVSRHEAPAELLRFRLESGREIRATKSHSFVTRVDGGIEPVRGDSLSTGDELPIAGEFDEGRRRVDLEWFNDDGEQVATDGGAALEAPDDGTIVGTCRWDSIESIEAYEPDDEYVYDLSVAGLETFTTAQGVVTHNTMNTFHYAGVAEIDVTQGLPRLIELVDARKEPDTPMMTVHLEGEYATERERAHEVVWQIEATKILALGDISTNVADMRVQVNLNEETLRERWPATRLADTGGADPPMLRFAGDPGVDLPWVVGGDHELVTREETPEEQLTRAIEGSAAAEPEGESYFRLVEDPGAVDVRRDGAGDPLGVVVEDGGGNVWGISVKSQLRALKRTIKDEYGGTLRGADDRLRDEGFEALEAAVEAGELDSVVVPDAGVADEMGILPTIEKQFGDEIADVVREGTVIAFGPSEPSYRDLLQLVERLRDVVFKGIEDVSRVVIRKEEAPERLDRDEEFVLYTEGSALSEVLDIWGVDASRSRSNNIHEIHENLGIEAARNAIIEETMDTLEEQGLDDVNVRHLMLVADIMTNRGEIQSIGRHGISGSKESVLARAAFEVTVNHLLEAATHGEVDDLNGVTENVIVGKPIKLGTGDVDLRMGSFSKGEAGGDAD